MKEPFSYVVRAALACGVLYWALDLSAPDRTWVDYMVIALIGLAIAWNMVRAGQRFHRAGSGRAVWHLQRTALFWALGLMNTLLQKPEAAGGWRNWLGWALLGLAVLDSIALYRLERRTYETHSEVAPVSKQ